MMRLIRYYYLRLSQLVQPPNQRLHTAYLDTIPDEWRSRLNDPMLDISLGNFLRDCLTSVLRCATKIDHLFVGSIIVRNLPDDP